MNRRGLRWAWMPAVWALLVACGKPQPANPVTEAPAPAAGREAPPPEGKVVLFRLAQDGSELKRVEVAAPPADAALLARVQALVKGLADPAADPETLAPIPELSAVNAVYTVRDTLVVDMNGAFAQGVGPGGTETLDAVRAITRTLSANLPEVSGLRILLEGQDPGDLNGVELAWHAPPAADAPAQPAAEPTAGRPPSDSLPGVETVPAQTHDPEAPAENAPAAPPV